MSLLEYLEIITTVLNKYLENLDRLYEEAKFTTNKYGSRPICFTITNGELGLILRKNVYSMSSKESKTTNIISKFYKSSLSDNYNCEEGSIYPMNSNSLKEAVEFVEENKENIKQLFKRIQFYHESECIIIEFEKFNPNRIEFDLEITKGIRNKNHLSLNVRKRYFETVDLFLLEWLKTIKVPESVIPEFIKEKMQSNNFTVDGFTKEELEIHPWHSDYVSPKEPQEGYTRKRGFKLW